MDRIRDFLSGFDDHELAFFARYKLKTYMPESQEVVRTYLSERNVSEVKIKELIHDNPASKLADNKTRCTRCYSDKLRKTRVAWAETAKFHDFEVKKNGGKIQEENTPETEVICDVCGLKNGDPSKPKGSAVGGRMKNYFRSVLDGILNGL